MKKILLLSTRSSAKPESPHLQNLCAVLQKAAGDSAQYEYAYYDNLLHIISTDDALIALPDGRGLDSFDLVYHRLWISDAKSAASVAIFLQKRGVSFVDSEVLSGDASDKLVQHWRMWEQNVPFPKTIALSSSPDAEDWLRHNLEQAVGLPCIVKGSNSQRGEDNYLLHSVEEVIRLLADTPNVSFLIQQYIPNDCDYRVFVCGETIGLVIRRTAGKDTHKNNTSQGGAAELVAESELPEAARKLCIRAAQIFGRQIAGVDLVFDKQDNQKYYIFEVNRAPQIDTATFADEKARAINAYFLSLAR